MANPLDTIAEGERLHGLMIANAGGDFEVDCDEEFRIWCKRRLPALLAVARAAEKRLRYGHNDTCSSVLGIKPPYNVCSCGHDEQAAALDRLTPENPDA